jgi:hypothetical protein
MSSKSRLENEIQHYSSGCEHATNLLFLRDPFANLILCQFFVLGYLRAHVLRLKIFRNPGWLYTKEIYEDIKADQSFKLNKYNIF